MAKKIIWSLKAQNDRKQILEYWKNRNKSNTYSIKLNELFKEAIRLISTHPKIGKLTSKENTRVKIVKDYLIIYEETQNQIIVLTILDSRRDPDVLNETLK